MTLYDRVAELSVDVRAMTTETREAHVSDDFARTTTTVSLEGDGETGRGEDVIYDDSLHGYPDGLEATLRGRRRFDEFSDRLGTCDLFGAGVDPEEGEHRHRRWALESAALDLALNQRGTNLAGALGGEYRPVRFVVSPSVDDHDVAELRRWIEHAPGIEFKLDAKSEWNRDLVADLAALDRVRIVDFKSHYEEFGRDPDPELYRLVARGFDDAILEDPKLTRETRDALAGHEHRLAWDKPVTGVEAIEALPVTPSNLNVKPSRIGTVESLLSVVEYCREENVRMYGGGQFELGVGRGHIQALASLFYPDAPNDVAPAPYRGPDLPEDPPESPLRPDGPVAGLEWRYRT